MFKTLVIILVVLLVLYSSVKLRARKIAVARSRNRSFEDVSSPLGQAIKDFVAVAGGTYLGLMALTEFLKIPAPVKGELWGITFDPIAVVAVLLAAVAPLWPSKE